MQPESLFFRRSFHDADEDERNRTECFRTFDRRDCGHWDADDCRRFVQCFLTKSSNMAAEWLARDIFAEFAREGRIAEAQFQELWRGVVLPLLRPTAALLVVDVQNDFINGSLAMRHCAARQEGSEVIPVINGLIREMNFAAVAYTLDWHPDDHISFHSNLHLHPLERDSKNKSRIGMFDTVRFAGGQEQTLWPKHCVEGTWGAKLHDDLVVNSDEGSIVVKKGTERGVDSYSAFFDNARRGKTALEAELKKRGVTHAVACGLAFDYCVGSTVLDALSLGFPTVLVRDASKGTDEVKMAEMEEKIRFHHGVVVDAAEVGKIVRGEDIREEFVRVLLQAHTMSPRIS